MPTLLLLHSGAYHSGVEINGVELAFGGCSTAGKTGVWKQRPCIPPPVISTHFPARMLSSYRTCIGVRVRISLCYLICILCCCQHWHPGHAEHLKSIEMGVARLPSKELDRIVERFEAEWLGEGYDPLTRNCNHFSNAVCLKLVGAPIPEWVNRAAVKTSTLLGTAPEEELHTPPPASQVGALPIEPRSSPRLCAREFQGCVQKWC